MRCCILAMTVLAAASQVSEAPELPLSEPQLSEPSQPSHTPEPDALPAAAGSETPSADGAL